MILIGTQKVTDTAKWNIKHCQKRKKKKSFFAQKVALTNLSQMKTPPAKIKTYIQLSNWMFKNHNSKKLSFRDYQIEFREEILETLKIL